MAQLAQSVKSILYFVILIAFTEIIMPNVRYKKYIKMVMGMILILMVLTPLAGLLAGKGVNYSFDGALSGLQAAENSSVPGDDGAGVDTQWNDMLKSAFDEQVKAQISDMAASAGFSLVDARITTNPDMSAITGVDMTVTAMVPAQPTQRPFIRIEPVTVGNDGQAGDTGPETDTLKKSISDFYKLAADNINISVQKKN